MSRRATLALVLALCLPPLVTFSSLDDPFGQSESSLNAAIWALGARNIVEKGFVEAKLGALVAPFHGVQNGIYAHHPPLPIWISVITIVAGGNEAVPRSLALCCVLASLVLVYSICRRETSALVAAVVVLFAATIPYVLTYSRLLTTLTIAAPLFLWLIHDVLERRTRRAALAMFLLVLSSWDGVIGAASVLVFSLYRRERTLPLFVACAAGLGIDAFYIANASGGFAEVLHQAVWRSGVHDESITPWAFASTQWRFICGGLSLTGIAVLALRLLSMKKLMPLRAVFLVSLAPGLLMTLLFRHGAQRHAFWAFQLWIAAAFALASLLTRVEGLRVRWRVLAAAAMAVASVLNVFAAREALLKDRALDAVGIFAQQVVPAQMGSPVKMLAATSFQVYIPWYLRFEIDVALTPADFAQRLEKAWRGQDKLMVDQLWLDRYGCRLLTPSLAASVGGRFVIAPASAIFCPSARSAI